MESNRENYTHINVPRCLCVPHYFYHLGNQPDFIIVSLSLFEEVCFWGFHPWCSLVPPITWLTYQDVKGCMLMDLQFAENSV